MKRIIISLAVILTAMTINAKTPVIGISGFTNSGVCSANMTYIKSVRQAGGVPLVIPVTSDDAQIEAVVNAVDGLIMTGGEDFDPLKWYGEEPLRALGEVVPERDEFDVKLVRAAVAKGIPVLGICRGEQLLAVAFGGSLWQDIPSQVGESFVKHRQGSTTSSYGTHSISIDKGSFLEKVTGSAKATVNSFHHQAVKDVPKGLKVIARSADGIVEGVERSGRLEGYADGGALIIGTQFHPECLVAGGDPYYLGIFKLLVEESSK
ncbi:MAG: gamma-glutamyl-gamma-aminobutyrate hydrolase family protein [Bacteroidales bacterium]|nr:gamma-glutamyl-gamma-aminobutyrate hydrolase family protein [Candidatus Cacconaster caballi]